jgi:hypothetical protein
MFKMNSFSNRYEGMLRNDPKSNGNVCHTRHGHEHATKLSCVTQWHLDTLSEVIGLVHIVSSGSARARAHSLLVVLGLRAQREFSNLPTGYEGHTLCKRLTDIQNSIRRPTSSNRQSL